MSESPQFSPNSMGRQEKDKVYEELKILRDKWSKEKKEGDPEIS